MKRYFIRTIQDNLTCEYDYRQYKEVITMLKENGTKYTTWIVK